ncbi:MAG: T9SS type A sorting domain-containing protein [Saprospiraceae bacterium]|nr:T9SS type A sorting domain-containing protein [Saprospiraceae bacterium]
MKNCIFTLIQFLCLTVGIWAQQHSTCDGSRYVTSVFTSVDVTQGVLYGNNNTISGTNQDLFMDVYEPTGDAATNRPVIVLAFGGSFIGGSRGDLDWLCRYYTKMGFVAVTIDYRLYDGPLFPIPSTATMKHVVVKAVADMKAAVRFLREDAATTNLFKIDPNLIFVGGISAGAIVAGHMAYLDSTDSYDASIGSLITSNGGWQGNSSNNTQYSSDVMGVLNFSGALVDASYIDANDPPLFSAHDDSDGTVPYGAGSATIFTIPIINMEGSGLMHPEVLSVGGVSELITIPNSSGHVSYFTGSSSWEDSVKISSCRFVNDIVCPQSTDLFLTDKQELYTKFYPNPTDGDMNIFIQNLASKYNICVIDNMGRIVFQDKGINDSFYILKRNNFTSGIYYVNITFDNSKFDPVISKIMIR